MKASDWREQKKARTRANLQEHALRLFLEQGYDNTTVEQIAAAAGVSHMTFFRHFPTKEDVVLRDEYDPLLESLIASRPTGEPPVTRVRSALRDALGEVYPEAREAILVRTRLMLRTPALRARSWENQHTTGRLLERALSGQAAPDLRTRVVAAACLAAITTAIEAWADADTSTASGTDADTGTDAASGTGTAGGNAAELPELIDQALAVLEGIDT
ncbi:MAG: TetR/AcrR family transcriptional regulator [Micromonosporaceae bacterium]